MKEQFVSILVALDEAVLDEAGRGRPKKEVDPEAEVKVKGKRGRPAKTAEDSDEGEGVRDITLHATITGGKGKNRQEATESKTLKGVSADDIKKIVKDFEYMLSVKFANKWDFDEDEINVETKDSLGWTGARAEDQTSDDEGSDSEDTSYSFGRKDQ